MGYKTIASNQTEYQTVINLKIVQILMLKTFGLKILCCFTIDARLYTVFGLSMGKHVQTLLVITMCKNTYIVISENRMALIVRSADFR